MKGERRRTFCRIGAGKWLFWFETSSTNLGSEREEEKVGTSKRAQPQQKSARWVRELLTFAKYLSWVVKVVDGLRPILEEFFGLSW